MHCNDLKYEDNVDFCYITKSFRSMEVKLVFFWGGGGVGLFWASCSEEQNMGCDGVKWTRNGLYDPLNPYTMYHT